VCYALRCRSRPARRPAASSSRTGEAEGGHSCPSCRLCFLHLWTVGADAGIGRHPKVACGWNLAVMGVLIRDHPGPGPAERTPAPRSLRHEGLARQHRRPQDPPAHRALPARWRQPRERSAAQSRCGLGRGRLGSRLVRCDVGDRAGYTSRAADRQPAHSGRIGSRPWCSPSSSRAFSSDRHVRRRMLHGDRHSRQPAETPFGTGCSGIASTGRIPLS
jgi:hypothetical protein